MRYFLLPALLLSLSACLTPVDPNLFSGSFQGSLTLAVTEGGTTRTVVRNESVVLRGTDELVRTSDGSRILGNLLIEIAGCPVAGGVNALGEIAGPGTPGVGFHLCQLQQAGTSTLYFYPNPEGRVTGSHLELSSAGAAFVMTDPPEGLNGAQVPEAERSFGLRSGTYELTFVGDL